MKEYKANKLIDEAKKISKNWDEMEEKAQKIGYTFIEINKMNIWSARLMLIIKELEKDFLKSMQTKINGFYKQAHKIYQHPLCSSKIENCKLQNDFYEIEIIESENK